ncbi:M36 family metallopeptidase [Streptomyces chilikensis]|uniref:M36 family metallopeptidase n=1 Tax=Streptomyces chilikensis TaxID=1194079 RepID=UPI000AA57DCF|nr:M36 family metallopeptidase [Streptomyces chilikensis]
MTQLIDKRDLAYDRLTEIDDAGAFLRETGRIAESLNHTLEADDRKVNRFTGHLTELRVSGAPGLPPGLERADGGITDGDYVARAKEYLSSVTEALGFASDEPAEFDADPNVPVTHGGMRVVSLQQTLSGIEVWGMAPKVWLREDGTVDRVVGDTASLPAHVSAAPEVTAEAALTAAVAKAAEPVTLETPFGSDELPALEVPDALPRLTFQPRNDQPMTFAKGPFDEEIPCRLVYLYMGDDVRLTWSFTLSRNNMAVQYGALVEADGKTADKTAPQILHFQDLTDHAVAGKVFRRNPAESTFDKVPFPLPVDDYPVRPRKALAGFPNPWVERHDGHVATVGNNVTAVDGDSELQVEIEVDAAGDAVFEPLPDSPEQFVTNIFFFCNYMHDFFQMLGFDEKHGNFQVTNASGEGRGADPVRAFAHPRQVPGTANMTTPPDGGAAVMNMGLVRHTGRHTANDGDVVFHEFTHGVSNRLVGGLLDAQGLKELQSRSMGEGWSDFFALTTRNSVRGEDRTVVGDWVVADPGGIRQRPYDAQYPGGFGDIGKGPGQLGGLDYTRIHNVGEIWCAALMDMVCRSSAALGDKQRAHQIAWMAVVDGMKLTPKNPSLLTARDAVLRALRDLEENGNGTAEIDEGEYAAVRPAAWEAFARFGMGFDAFCPNASFHGCRAGSAMPPEGHVD